MAKNLNGGHGPREVWVTHRPIYDGSQTYLSGVNDKPWDRSYDAPITKYASNERYVRADLAAKPTKGRAVSNKMLAAAQASYEGNPEYGLTDQDMKRAIAAALRAME